VGFEPTRPFGHSLSRAAPYQLGDPGILLISKINLNMDDRKIPPKEIVADAIKKVLSSRKVVESQEELLHLLKKSLRKLIKIMCLGQRELRELP